MDTTQTTSVNRRVIDRIACFDSRYRGHTADGLIVLEDEAGGRTFLTGDQYQEQHPVQTCEEFFCTVDIAIDDIGNTTVTPTQQVVDLLLDLRVLFARYKAEEKDRRGLVWGMLQNAWDELQQYRPNPYLDDDTVSHPDGEGAL